jgi:hypothetical protein
MLRRRFSGCIRRHDAKADAAQRGDRTNTRIPSLLWEAGGREPSTGTVQRPKNPEHKAPWNQIRNIPRVFTPEDKAVKTPNSDTPYSMAGLGRPHPSTRSPETPCSDEV